ncbi:hypothetical protein EHS25_005737 [Saitozyma podzolica]|uniref:histidine kinase n=1 Tax=Saitozyma podzolica TaxID=1890683 RepID=A0A427XW41_9TREE|nr:hypothetical protein EHS25_005737 [Saitozyma podzolica]
MNSSSLLSSPRLAPDLLSTSTNAATDRFSGFPAGMTARSNEAYAANGAARLTPARRFRLWFRLKAVIRICIPDWYATNRQSRSPESRRVWYTPDNSEGIARSITYLMPPGTETSMAMPVFGFDSQVAFAVAACWTDPLYTYPAGAMQFVETITGSLLASVMKEKLYQVERAQLNFAAAASHELRTPLHQTYAAAALLRDSLRAAMGEPSFEENLDPSTDSAQTSPRCPPPTPVALEIIETNGLAFGHILENIIDTLDIGRMSERLDGNGDLQPSVPANVLEGIIKDAFDLETKSRSVAVAEGLEDVEIILEVSPRVGGRWLATDDAPPLASALGKIIHNACKFTDKGYVHVTIQDASPDAVLPAGYDNSIKMSTVMINIKDSGRGIFEALRPFSKADPLMPGTGLGLRLAPRMIEILGGKLAISSIPGKGTLVHVEIPFHLLNEDNELDQEGLDDNADGPPQPRSPVRQDGINLAGFDSAGPGVRRVGRSLLRQHKLLFCRVVDNIRFASLIVLHKGSLTDEELARLASSPRPNVEIIYLASPPSHRASPRLAASAPSAAASAAECLSRIPTTRLFRPLRRSVVRRIKQPSGRPPPPHENYVSPVVGGESARWDDNAARRGSVFGPTDEGEELVPSPLHGLRLHISDDNDHDHLTSPEWTSHELTSGPPPTRSHSGAGPHKSSKLRRRDRTPRPDLREGASDPLSAVGTVGRNEDARPDMKDHRSEMVADGGKGADPGPLRVLVVEDNPVNRKILTTTLERAGKFRKFGSECSMMLTLAS